MSELNTYKAKLSDLKALEAKIFAEFQQAISQNIENCEPLSGVKPLGPYCCSVPLSTVMKEKNMLATTFIPQSQVDMLMKLLFPTGKTTSIEVVEKKIKEIIDANGRVPRSRMSGDIFIVNSNMLEVLQRIYNEIFEGGDKNEGE